MLTLPSQPAALAARFAETGYLPLPCLLTPTGLAALREECGRLEAAARRRDFRMASMGESPRHMTTLGGHHIARESGLISALYRGPELLALLSALYGAGITTVAEPVERHVLNILHRPGDTHGAHTDDYPLALVLFLQAPLRVVERQIHPPSTRLGYQPLTPTAPAGQPLNTHRKPLPDNARQARRIHRTLQGSISPYCSITY
ncbi:hypothetical protein [Streptomyces sp. NPDC058701]|uniref:HalD/BesD family halogenase n=1 Tax=Streptomyces sp. NPDC058701 TaxID=3346608 RepID=UPI003651D189